MEVHAQGWLAIRIETAAPLAATLLLTACAASHVSPEDPSPFLPDRTSAFKAGDPRAGVRGALGAPVLSSAYWGFDLFRADTEQTEVMLAVTPIPIPFGRITDTIQRYTLVTYDASFRARAAATGLFRRPTDWRRASPIRSDMRGIHLRAGELMFFVDPEGTLEPNLLATPAGRDSFLQRAPSSKGCTIVLGCGDRGCGDRLSVDAGPVRPLPVRTAHAYWFTAAEKEAWLKDVAPHGGDPKMPWLETLTAVTLAPGEHTLEFSAAHTGGSTALTLACGAGEVTYLTIHATRRDSFWGNSLVDWRIERSGTLPAPFARRPLVLVSDGQWYVDAEPFGAE